MSVRLSVRLSPLSDILKVTYLTGAHRLSVCPVEHILNVTHEGQQHGRGQRTFRPCRARTVCMVYSGQRASHSAWRQRRVRRDVPRQPALHVARQVISTDRGITRPPLGERSITQLHFTTKCDSKKKNFFKQNLTGGKVLSWEYRSPQKRNSLPPASLILCWVSWVENVLLIYYASSDLFVCLHWQKFVYIGKNPRFTAFLDSNLHFRLAIVIENELGLAYP